MRAQLQKKPSTRLQGDNRRIRTQSGWKARAHRCRDNPAAVGRGAGRCLRVFEGHEHHVQSVEWSADGERLSPSGDTTIRLWDVPMGRCLRVLRGHMGYVECVAWSPCERRVLSGNDDHTVRLWDIKAGHCVRLFEGHTGIVTSVAWSADRQRAISGGSDYTVRLWM